MAYVPTQYYRRQFVSVIPLQFPSLVITRLIESFVEYLFFYGYMTGDLLAQPPEIPNHLVFESYQKWIEFLRTLTYTSYYLDERRDNAKPNARANLLKQYTDIYFKQPPIITVTYQMPQIQQEDLLRYRMLRPEWYIDYYAYGNIPKIDVLNIDGEFIIRPAITRVTMNVELSIFARSQQQLYDFQVWLLRQFGSQQKYITLDRAKIFVPLVPNQTLFYKLLIPFIRDYLNLEATLTEKSIIEDYLMSKSLAINICTLKRHVARGNIRIPDYYENVKTASEQEYSDLYYFMYPMLNVLVRLNDITDNSTYLPGQDLNVYMLTASFEFQFNYPHSLVVSLTPRAEYILFKAIFDQEDLQKYGVNSLDELIQQDNQKLEQIFLLKVAHGDTKTAEDFEGFDMISSIKYVPDKQSELFTLAVLNLAKFPDDLLNKPVAITFSKNVIDPDTWNRLVELQENGEPIKNYIQLESLTSDLPEDKLSEYLEVLDAYIDSDKLVVVVVVKRKPQDTTIFTEQAMLNLTV